MGRLYRKACRTAGRHVPLVSILTSSVNCGIHRPPRSLSAMPSCHRIRCVGWPSTLIVLFDAKRQRGVDSRGPASGQIRRGEADTANDDGRGGEHRRVGGADLE
jgi:hypothetical protein